MKNMSVKGKIKKLNRELEKIKQENIKQADYILYLETLKNGKTEREKLLENIIKFAITNQIGGLKGGMMIDRVPIDKMKDLRLYLEESPVERAYIMRVNY